MSALASRDAQAQQPPATPTPPVAPTPPAAPSPPAADVRLDLVIGELKLLALDDTKSWSVVPESGLGARAVDDGHTLRLVAQKDGVYLVRIERNDGTTSTYVVHVGKAAASAPVVGPPTATPPAGVVGVVGVVGKSDPNAPPVATDNSADARYYANTLDLNLEGGIGRHFGDPAKTIGFGRARVGVMFARWPIFTMLGATYELSNLAPGAFGVQGELLHLSGGTWGQAGASVDTHGKAGVMAALGFSVIGVEGQYRGYQDDNNRLVTGFAVLAKVRIPIGVILYAFDKNRRGAKDQKP